MNATVNVDTSDEREIVVTRVFSAPADLIFKCHTVPEYVQVWLYGPEGWHMPVCEIDLRVGGAWRFVHAHPTGQAAFHGEYLEIDPPGRMVFTEIFEEFPDVVTTVTSELTEEGGKTRLTATVRYPSKEVRDVVKASGMEHGAGLSYDRLEDLLAELSRS
jgi:uncharacterized protein YndB with AHSA1/START domain